MKVCDLVSRRKVIDLLGTKTGFVVILRAQKMSSGARKAGDLGMKVAVTALFALTLGLAGSTFSQMGFLVRRRFGGKTEAIQDQKPLPENPSKA